jgi:hypothetical protein
VSPGAPPDRSPVDGRAFATGSEAEFACECVAVEPSTDHGVDRHRVAGGRRVLRRHRTQHFDLVVADAEVAERVRHAELAPELQHPGEECAKRRLQAEIGGESRDPRFNGRAIEGQHVGQDDGVGHAVVRVIKRPDGMG